MHPSPIVPLSSAVISQVRSSSQVYSLSHAVEEVVANSIDAESTCIGVTVDFNEYSFTVKDNGCGVESSSMTHICKRHFTSKSRTSPKDGEPPIKFGYRGESLASIAAMAVVHITSRGQGSFETMSKIVRGGKVLKCGVSLKARTQSGTTVSVRNFMYNRPVRQKQAIRTRSQQCKELGHIRDALFRMLLPAPHVELGLYVAGDEEPLLHLTQGRTKEFSLQYIFNDHFDSLIHLSQTSDAMSIEGSILLPPSGHHSKEKQYFYVNGRHMHCKKASEIIGNLFKRVCENLDKARGWTVEGAAGSRYPGFILNVSCPRNMYELHCEPNKATVVFSDPSKISSLVQGAVLAGWGSVLSDAMIQELQQRGQKNSKREMGCVKLLRSGDEPMHSNGKLTSRQRRGEGLDGVGPSGNREKIKGGNKIMFCIKRGSFMAPSLSSRRRSLGSVNVNADFVSDAERSMKLRRTDCTKDGGEARRRANMSSTTAPHLDLGSVMVDSSGEKVPQWVQRGDHVEESHIECSESFDECNDLGSLEIKNCKRKSREWDIATGVDEWKNGGSLGSRDVFDHGGGGEAWDGLLDCDVDGYYDEDVGWDGCNHAEGSRKASNFKSFASPRHHSIDEEWQLRESNWVPNNGGVLGWEKVPDANHKIDDFGVVETADGVLSDAIAVDNFPPLYSRLNSPVPHIEWRSGCGRKWDGVTTGNRMHPDQSRINKEEGLVLHDFLVTEAGCTGESVAWDQKDMKTRENHHRQQSPVPECNRVRLGSRRCRRAVSAPPHPKNRHKGFHSNPLMSLKTRHPCDKGKLNSTFDRNPLTSLRGTFRGVQTVLHPDDSAMNRKGKERTTAVVGTIAQDADDYVMASSDVLNMDKNVGNNDPFWGIPSTRKRVRFIDDNGKISLSGRSDWKMKVNPSHETKDVPLQSNGLHRKIVGESIREEDGRTYHKTSRKILSLDGLLDDFSDPSLAALNEQRISSVQHFAPLQSVVPQSVSRAIFEQARILCQVDKKFVLMVCGDVVVAVDQHAADERVRLEALQKDLVSVGHESGLIQAEELDSSVAVNLTHLEQQVFETYKEKVEHWGWKGELDPPNGNLILTHRPLLFGSPMNSTELKIYLNHLEDTGGPDILPPCVLRVLKSKACRSAIMFGDALCFSMCCDLIAKLKKTRFCFSCAHGRPTMVPLADVRSLQRAIETEKRGLDVLDVPKREISLDVLKKSLNVQETGADCRQ